MVNSVLKQKVINPAIRQLLPLSQVIITNTYSVGGTDPGISWFHWLNDTVIVVELLKSLLPSMSLVSSVASKTLYALLCVAVCDRA